MAALALSLALLAYWGVLGLALLSVLYTGRNACQRLLLAPAVGIVVLLFPTYWLNQAGLAVGRFGPALGIALLLGGLAVLAWRRPLVPVRHAVPLAAAVLAGLGLTGRPMLSFGFDWLSFANDDMANYCLLAQRLLTRGFHEPPAPGSIARGVDYAGYYWTYHAGGVRPGTDLLLAWLASVTRLNTQQAFMPCIVALHGALLAAMTAVVYRTRRDRPAAILAAWLLAAAALVSLGTLYQLIAQVLGLVLLAALVAVIAPHWSARPWRRAAHGVLAGLVGAGLLLGYPEIVPFAGVAVAAYLTLAVWRRQVPLRALLRVLAAAVVTALALLGTRAVTAVGFLVIQGGAGVATRDPSQILFPYLLLPSGLANVAGLQSIAGVTPEPWGSLTIALGAALVLLTVAAALRLAWRGEPIGLVATTMLGVGAGLYARGVDFGLFKLAMFFQPFMAGTLAVAALLGRRRAWWAIAVVVFVAGNLWVQAVYVDHSRGRGVMSELRDASATRLPALFSRAVAAAPPAALDFDTANVVLAKILALHLDGVPATFLARDFFFNIHRSRYYEDAVHRVEVADAFARFAAQVGVRRSLIRFPLLNDAAEDNLFSAPAPGTTAERVPGGALVLSTGAQSVFNRRALGREAAPFLIRPYREVANHLVFMHSRLGQHYYAYEDRTRIALFQIERDPLLPGSTIAALGRHLVFRVVNPGRSLRLAVTLTASFKGDGQNRLPPAAVIGEARVPLPLVGSGSARVFSPAVTPRDFEGQPYLAIDMNVDGALIRVPRRGLMSLYGRGVAVDSRRVVAFTRDISLVSEEEYRALEPPRSVSSIPRDLANPALEYSGVYEDGWIAEHAYFQLTRAPGADVVTVRGRTQPGPDGVPPQELVVLVDGREVSRQPISGEFSLRVEAPPGPGRARVDLRVSPLRRFDGLDNREVGFLLRSIGFEPGRPAS
jgi:hypothetical protein